MSVSPANDSDRREIEALNQQDVEAVMAGDVTTIISQWTEDFVVLSAGSIVRGRTANAEIAERSKAQIETMEVLEYQVNFEEVEVMGDYAYEWGTYRGKTRIRAKWTGHLLWREAAENSAEGGGLLVENAPHDGDRRSAFGVAHSRPFALRSGTLVRKSARADFAVRPSVNAVRSRRPARCRGDR